MTKKIAHLTLCACMAFLALSTGCNSSDEGSDGGDTTGDTTGGDGGNGGDTGGSTDPIDGGDPGAPDLAWPATPDAYTTNGLSYVNALTLPAVGSDNVPVCCKDFGAFSRDNMTAGTNNIDNALASLAVSLQSMAQLDLQDALTAGVEAGGLVMLWDHFGLASTGEGDFTLVPLRGEFEGTTDFAAASAGNGTFLIDPLSFETGTATPTSALHPANLTSGALTSGPSAFLITIPLAGGILLDVILYGAEVEGTATFDVDGTSYVDGTISGWILNDELFAAINTFLGSPACSCLGATEPIYTQDIDGRWTGTGCIADAATSCTADSELGCVALAGSDVGAGGFCSFVGALFGGLPDLNIDGDPTNFEGISFGLQWTGVPADDVGVVTP